tara:strand:- start:248 stop:430 length:183 start_codon:yes stop_codon:yes gene_type:complete
MALPYKLIKDPSDSSKEHHKYVKRINGDKTETWIPKLEENRDYRQFLAWKAAGNTPEAAD